MIYDTKKIRVLLMLHITQKHLESPEKQNTVQLTVMENIGTHCVRVVVQ